MKMKKLSLYKLSCWYMTINRRWYSFTGPLVIKPDPHQLWFLLTQTPLLTYVHDTSSSTQVTPAAGSRRQYRPKRPPVLQIHAGLAGHQSTTILLIRVPYSCPLSHDLDVHTNIDRKWAPAVPICRKVGKGLYTPFWAKNKRISTAIRFSTYPCQHLTRKPGRLFCRTLEPHAMERGGARHEYRVTPVHLEGIHSILHLCQSYSLTTGLFDKILGTVCCWKQAYNGNYITRSSRTSQDSESQQRSVASSHLARLKAASRRPFRHICSPKKKTFSSG